MALYSFFLLWLILFAASAAGTWAFVHYATRTELMDTPNHRSSHSTPTPRGGGIVIVILATSIWILAAALDMLSLKQGLALIIAGAIVAITGYMDDKGHVSKGTRFSAHILASISAVILLSPLPSVAVSASYTLDLNHILTLPIVIIAIVWLTNLYNFMDGIDGIATSEALCVLMASGITLYLMGETDQAKLLALLFSIVLGFLIWNWSPAKLFMGDVGSTYLGMSFGILALITAEALSIWFWIIILATFIGDATWTLIARIFTGQNWREPHRLHAYQKVSPAQQQHKSATLLYSIFTLSWLFPLAYLTAADPSYFFVTVTLAYTPMLIFCYKNDAGLISEGVS